MQAAESICEECIMNRSFCFERLLVAAIAAVGICTAAASGGTIYVDDDGPADYSRIQDAIDAAVDGDTVNDRDGRYTGDGSRDINFSHGLPEGQGRFISSLFYPLPSAYLRLRDLQGQRIQPAARSETTGTFPDCDYAGLCRRAGARHTTGPAEVVFVNKADMKQKHTGLEGLILYPRVRTDCSLREMTAVHGSERRMG